MTHVTRRDVTAPRNARRVLQLTPTPPTAPRMRHTRATPGPEGCHRNVQRRGPAFARGRYFRYSLRTDYTQNGVLSPALIQRTYCAAAGLPIRATTTTSYHSRVGVDGPHCMTVCPCGCAWVDSGKTVDTVVKEIKRLARKNTPTIKIACLFYKVRLLPTLQASYG